LSLDWPAGFERTSPAERSANHNYDVTLARAFSDLETELDRLDVDEYRYSFDARQRKTDQRPYSRASPDDPGFVLRWTMEGYQHAVACDRYSRLRDNVRTIGLYLREKRKMEQRPVETGESEFANARLPPADEDDDVIVAGNGAREPPHEILEVDPDADDDVVEAAFRAKVSDAHPDQGGSRDELQKLQTAREAMLDE
jgi:hypothetical protein